jgi:hypothetical protein
MKEPKAFDCVEMKRKIQEQLRRGAAEMGEEEARKMQWQRALSDPIIGPVLRAITNRVPAEAK